MKRATEIYSHEFDSILFTLPSQTRAHIIEKIRDLGTSFEQFPHVRLQGRAEFRLRAGDYRVIYKSMWAAVNFTSSP